MKRTKEACDLKSCSFCRQCLQEWLPAVAATRQTFAFKKGETLVEEGEKVTGIYFLNNGKVKVHSRWDEGRELIVRFAGPGDIVGHRGWGKNLIYPITATALEPLEACFIPIEFFEASLRVNPDYMYKLLMFYASELQETEQRMRNLAHLPVKGRIANALLLLREKYGADEQGKLNIEISKQDISSFVGATYETVFRTINELTEQQLILTKGKQFYIPSVEKLLEIVAQKSTL